MAASSDNRSNERSGGGEAEQEERTDGWMTTYSDMVTLLLTFFVLMFALSNIDNERVEMFLFAMSRDGLTAEQFMEIRERFEIDETDGSEWDEMMPYPPPGQHDEWTIESEGHRALRALAGQISDYVEREGLGDDVLVTFSGDALLLTLANDILFAPGRADITEEMATSADIIGRLLAEHFNPRDPFEIVVAGHTDNVPQDSPEFPSNWHLSNGRAMAVLTLLLESSGIPSPYFYMRGCGEYRPIASNDTAEGRRQNRRVEIMISLANRNPLWDHGVPQDY